LSTRENTSTGSAATNRILDLRTRGLVSAEERDCAQAMISAVLARHTDAAGDPRVRLAGANCAHGLLLVQVNLRVCGAPARVQVAGRSAAAAIAAAAARLDRQIRRLSTAWEPWPWPDPERHVLGVPGDGQIARFKTYRLHVGMPCHAGAVMNAMDYDLCLYTDADTGEDAIVYRAGPTGFRLARQHSMHPPSRSATLPLTINPRKVATLTPAQAAARLTEHWLPFVFFTDRDSRRGNVLYRRYDGDLGLITPMTPDQTATSPVPAPSALRERPAGGCR
jgi:hypothetical protein